MSKYLRARAIGERIRTARRRRGITMRELAAEVGIHPVSVQQIETGASTASEDMLSGIALAVPLSTFVADLPVTDLSDEESEMLRLLRDLPAEGRAYFHGLVVDAAAGRVAR